MNSLQDIRTLFLEEFTKRILIKSGMKLPKIKKPEVLFDELDNVTIASPKLDIIVKKSEPIVISAPKEIALKVTIQQPIAQAQQPVIQVQPIAQVLQPTPQKKEFKTIEISEPKKYQQQIQKPSIQMPSTPKIPMIDRINRIFFDQAIQLLNCPGANKNILITRAGMVQATRMFFSEEEIKEFMRDLSEKTRIPIVPGLVKIMFQNYIITAVVSDILGTKFLIERRQLPQYFRTQPQAMARFR